MCIMYQKCKLIYVDLSEYNMLWYENKVWFIDVSQFVELTYFYVLEFFYRDCINVVEFFIKCRVFDILVVYDLFNKVLQLDIIFSID